MKKLLREPVLQFTLLGIALFFYFGAVTNTEPDVGQTDQIVISDAEVRQFIEQYKAVWHRPPTPQQLAALVDGAVSEEILVREALALGLDQGDSAIRNRLRQKMQFLTDSAAQMLEPEDEVLRTYMQENPDMFSQPARIAFEQVYLGERPEPADVDAALAQLAAGADPQALGRGGLLPPAMPLAAERQIDGAFGTGFFAALEEAEPGVWVGPVRSGYGAHLIRVTDKRARTLAEFETVRQNVLFDWRSKQAEALSKTQMDALRTRYQVVVPDQEALEQALSQ